MNLDSFYTPKKLANKLLSYIKQEKVLSVADFCLGDGELLRAAERRWPESNFFGCDISESAIFETQTKHTNWNIFVSDFLDNQTRQKFLEKNAEGFDIILLNPPYSCKGNVRYSVMLNGVHFSVSTAMRFIVTALQYLSETGVLYCILPVGVAYSQKDSTIWNYLKHNYNLTILEEPSERFFKNCEPNIILVAINDFNILPNQSQVSPHFDLVVKNFNIVRGNIGFAEKDNLLKGRYYFIHSTNLKNNRLEGLSLKVDTSTRSFVKGPAVLLARVGNPDKSKLCIIKKNQRFVISDCIIAIEFDDPVQTMVVFNFILKTWEDFKNLYKGTGAKYITKQKLLDYLNPPSNLYMESLKSEYNLIPHSN